MRVTRLAAVAIALAALTCVACLSVAGPATAATHVRAASPAPPASTPSCYAFAVRALQQHVVVHGMPPACAGLAPEQVNEAVVRALRTVVGPLHKAAARHQAVADSRYLGSLVRQVRPARPAPAVAAPGPVRSTVPARFAALAAWLAAAIPGAWLLARRLGRGRRLVGAPPAPFWVPASHAGMATAGLALWVAFLLTGSPLVGWLDVALTWLIAGLGMATLLADPPVAYGASASASAEASVASLTLPRARAPVLTIAAHGALAATTMALVLLAVLSVG